MGRVLVGTCSWTDAALVASGWYPRGTRDAEGRLRHYASRFPLVEVDATYYALPSARNSALWAARTPPGFLFDVKAYALLTGHTARVATLPPGLRPAGAARGAGVAADRLGAEALEEVWRAFAAGLAPLREAGRLGSLLLQFPPRLAPDPAAEEFVGSCVERAGRIAGMRAAVEFRHPGWLAPERLPRTLDGLRGLGAALVAVDTAAGLPRSVPAVAEATVPEQAVVRFHGRSPQWGTGSKEDRFRHRYTDAELRSWLPRVRRLAAECDEVHVLFNNCCGDAAVTAAERMRALLAADPDAPQMAGPPLGTRTAPAAAVPRQPAGAGAHDTHDTHDALEGHEGHEEHEGHGQEARRR